MSDNYEEYAPYRWHPCKQLEDTEIEECTAEEADFFGVYRRDEESKLLRHLFDCVGKYDAKNACSLLKHNLDYDRRRPFADNGPLNYEDN